MIAPKINYDKKLNDLFQSIFLKDEIDYLILYQIKGIDIEKLKYAILKEYFNFREVTVYVNLLLELMGKISDPDFLYKLKNPNEFKDILIPIINVKLPSLMASDLYDVQPMWHHSDYTFKAKLHVDEKVYIPHRDTIGSDYVL